MTMRANTLGFLALGMLLTGCPFEEPPVISEDSETTGDATTGGPTTTTPTTTTPTTTTTDTTTMDPTVDPTTMGPLDTTASTTSEVSATDSSSSSTTADPCDGVCEGLVCDMVDGCVCGECGPMATCAEDQTYCGLPVGFYNDFGTTDAPPAQAQFGFRFSVFEATTVRRLGVITAGAGAMVRLALYDHDGVGPANRLVQTGAVALYANGNNEFDVGATPIAAGDYWVMLHTEGSTPLRRTFNGDKGYEVALRLAIPFASGFPATMDDELIDYDYRYNLYMIVEE